MAYTFYPEISLLQLFRTHSPKKNNKAFQPEPQSPAVPSGPWAASLTATDQYCILWASIHQEYMEHLWKNHRKKYYVQQKCRTNYDQTEHLANTIYINHFCEKPFLSVPHQTEVQLFYCLKYTYCFWHSVMNCNVLFSRCTMMISE